MDYITAFIEVPKGSRNKYEYNHETGRIFLDRMLFSSVQYPADYGFIPETLAEDGDELDIPGPGRGAYFPRLLSESHPCGHAGDVG